MLYPNPEFLLLLVITLAGYGMCVGTRGRAQVLTLSSLAFYAWAGWLDTVIFLFVVVLSWSSIYLAHRFPGWRTTWLRAGITLLSVHLFVWKYANWITSQIQTISPGFLHGHKLALPLPVGISFFTLQGIAYLVDFGRFEAKVMPLSRYLLFKSFFGQLVAGPIVRAKQLAPQLLRLKELSSRNLNSGIALFILGYAKKVLIADGLARFVDPVFRAPQDYSFSGLGFALIFYAFQIWGDFSGYTDMGRGAARMFGIELPENFRSPYLSRSPSEFWRRWHITLSEWIRDYIYVPLGGNRGSALRVSLVLMSTMSLSGFWHGANWTFALWGLYHGMLLVVDHKTRALRDVYSKTLPPPVRALLGGVVTFGCVSLGWLVFRAENLGGLFAYLSALWAALWAPLGHAPSGASSIGSWIPYALSGAGMGLQILQYLDLRWGELLPRWSPRTLRPAIARTAGAMTWQRNVAWLTLLLCLLWVTLSSSLPERTQPFIYFRF